MTECLLDLLRRFGGASVFLATSSWILYGLTKLLQPNSCYFTSLNQLNGNA